ncbi:MAG: hypothetical protein ABSF26_18880 [Thermoguttaceae bacterium]|jgi:hypothetical protein
MKSLMLGKTGHMFSIFSKREGLKPEQEFYEKSLALLEGTRQFLLWKTSKAF